MSRRKRKTESEFEPEMSKPDVAGGSYVVANESEVDVEQSDPEEFYGARDKTPSTPLQREPEPSTKAARGGFTDKEERFAEELASALAKLADGQIADDDQLETVVNLEQPGPGAYRATIEVFPVRKKKR